MLSIPFLTCLAVQPCTKTAAQSLGFCFTPLKTWMKLIGLWKEVLLQLFSYFDSVYVESHICILHSSTYREPGEFDLIISSSFPMPGCLTPGIMVFSMSMIQIQGHFLGPSLFQSEIERGIQLFICNMQQLWSSFPEASVTMATCNSGRIETGCRLPSNGANF